MTALLTHPLWESLKGQVVVQYDRRGSDTQRPRPRFEVRQVIPEHLAITVPCAHCQQEIHPVRQRNQAGRSAYLAVTCPLPVNISCSRSEDSRTAYAALEAAIQGED